MDHVRLFVRLLHNAVVMAEKRATLLRDTSVLSTFMSRNQSAVAAFDSAC